MKPLHEPAIGAPAAVSARTCFQQLAGMAVRAPQGLVIFLLRLYRWTLSPLKNAVLGSAGCCRFSPTCSQYALDAVNRFGVAQGGVLSIKRLCRCQPWGGWGEDPVPSKERGRVCFTGDKLPVPQTFPSALFR